MFKKIVITAALVAVIGLLVFGAVNRTQAKTANERTDTRQVSAAAAAAEEKVSVFSESASVHTQPAQGNGNGGRGQGSTTAGSQLAVGTGELSAEETAALLYMREEEKLAHDVYVTLYETWGLPLFQNISRSEQAHADAVKTLIDRYGLTDPASSTVGVFTDPALQALYNDLVARGSQSLAEALKVGAAIEEIDILDLQADLAQADNADIGQVFNNLLRGSYSHLRAFVSTLQNQTGEIYTPQYLSAEAYQQILSTDTASGGYGQGGNRGAGGGRGGRP
ncbi:MAG: DUF2202 domain-containing protein [Anaerolineales bacterium]|jgi:hypothetical protein|nr:DUF2202 domain-containing protein [Anaerolineales bacterium]